MCIRDRCSDHLLEIINELLHMASDFKKLCTDKPDEVGNLDQDTPQIIYDAFLVNFESFIILLGASDITIVDKAAANILAFIHFSMIQGIAKNEHLVIKESYLQHILPAFKSEKTSICKNLIKSLYWALSLNKAPLRPSHDNTK